MSTQFIFKLNSYLIDVDILFKYGWQNEVEKIFTTIKNVGSVSPIPCRNFKNYETSSTLSKVLTKKVKFQYEAIPENHKAHNEYLKSFHWELETDKNDPLFGSNMAMTFVDQENPQFKVIANSPLNGNAEIKDY